MRPRRRGQRAIGQPRLSGLVTVLNNNLMSDAREHVGLYRRSMLTMLSNVVEPCPSTRHGPVIPGLISRILMRDQAR